MEKFNYETNGYNRQEVNNFVTDIINKFELLLDNIKSRDNEIAKLKEEINTYKNIDESISSSIKKYEEIGTSIKKLAEEESEMIISSAKTNASKIVNDALIKAEDIQHKIEVLENNLSIFKKKLKIIIEEQNAVIEEIDKLDIEE